MAQPALAPSRSCFDITGRSSNPYDVEFQLYHDPRAKDKWTKLPYKKKRHMKKSPWNVARKTKVLIHGLDQNGKAEFPQIVKDAYLGNEYRNTHNIIVVNWSALAAPNEVVYIEVLKRMRVVAKRVADFLVWLGRAMSLDLRKSVHVVGDGVGVHVAGMVGDYVIAKNNRIGRITGLDPKGAGFLSYYKGKRRLEKTDADFVDVYHTDVAKMETWNMFGQVDFFVNRTSAQRWMTPEEIENSNSNCVAHRIFAQTIMDGPFGNDVTPQLRLVDPNSVFSNPHRITVGEYCLPGTNGWFDISYQLLRSG